MRRARIDRISGGEARRVMLARVFATESEMFLLVEPIADLDPAASHATRRATGEAAAVLCGMRAGIGPRLLPSL